jgi:hypothetical protein
MQVRGWGPVDIDLDDPRDLAGRFSVEEMESLRRCILEDGDPFRCTDPACRCAFFLDRRTAERMEAATRLFGGPVGWTEDAPGREGT